MGMKAITLWQPWASLLAAGIKKNETRTWGTQYKGTLYIHAAQKVINVPSAIQLATKEKLKIYAHQLPKGQFVGIVNLRGCKRLPSMGGKYLDEYEYLEQLLGDYGWGRFVWFCEDHQRISPVECRGRQGIWTIPDNTLAVLEEPGWE